MSSCRLACCGGDGGDCLADDVAAAADHADDLPRGGLRAAGTFPASDASRIRKAGMEWRGRAGGGSALRRSVLWAQRCLHAARRIAARPPIG
jgi:hypothetical protein